MQPPGSMEWAQPSALNPSSLRWLHQIYWWGWWQLWPAWSFATSEPAIPINCSTKSIQSGKHQEHWWLDHSSTGKLLFLFSDLRLTVIKFFGRQCWERLLKNLKSSKKTWGQFSSIDLCFYWYVAGHFPVISSVSSDVRNERVEYWLRSAHQK